MASKLKKPPALHKKRTEEPTEEAPAPHKKRTEEPAMEIDSCTKVLKKLKVDIDGNCVNKAEDKSKDSLKHKTDLTAATEKDPGEHKEEVGDVDDAWCQSLQKFCLCDEKAINKRGRSKWKSMCRYHQLRMRTNSRSRRNSLNLAQAARQFHKPLLKESRLQVAEENKTVKSPPPILRLARFTFEKKSAKGSEEKSKSTKPVPDKASANSSEGSKTAICDKPSKDDKTPSQTVFAKAASENFTDFFSLLPCDEHESTGKNENPVPCFTNFRDGGGSAVRRTVGSGQVLLGEHGEPQSSRPSKPVGAACGGAVAPPPPSAAAAAFRDRVDLAVERSCSQEARLDEAECSVNELAAYFDHYFVIPKDMSLMAKMMYT